MPTVMYISGSSVSCWILLISRLQRRIKRDTQVLSTKICGIWTSSCIVNFHIPPYPTESDNPRWWCRLWKGGPRSWNESAATLPGRTQRLSCAQAVDTDRAWSRIKFSQYASRLALWKLTLKFQPRRSIWNGLPGPIRTTFGRSLRLAEFFWFDLHTMCIQCALPILGWCEAPFLDMGTCKVQGPKRFKLETLAWDYVQKVSKSKWRDGFWRFAWTLWSHGTIPV